MAAYNILIFWRALQEELPDFPDRRTSDAGREGVSKSILNFSVRFTEEIPVETYRDVIHGT
jgi:hypothetical protein